MAATPFTPSSGPRTKFGSLDTPRRESRLLGMNGFGEGPRIEGSPRWMDNTESPWAGKVSTCSPLHSNTSEAFDRK